MGRPFDAETFDFAVQVAAMERVSFTRLLQLRRYRYTLFDEVLGFVLALS